MDLTEDRGEAEEARASKDEEESRVETLVDLMEDGEEAKEVKVLERDEEKSKVEVLVNLTKDEGEVGEAKVMTGDEVEEGVTPGGVVVDLAGEE